jgi:hypothetical protein
MKGEQNPSIAEPKIPQGYQIQILGCLDQRWSDWFQGIEFTVSHEQEGMVLTIINCPSADQAQLRGIINKIWDLNMKLISVRQLSHADIKCPSKQG